MSANGRALRCAITPATISGSLFGSGTLEIPVGVVSVTVTGAGQPGGTTYVYNPGQPYIAEVPYTPRRATTSSYTSGDVFAWVSDTYCGTIYTTTNYQVATPPSSFPSSPPIGESVTIDGRVCWVTKKLLLSDGVTRICRVVSGTVYAKRLSDINVVEASAGSPAVTAGYYWRNVFINTIITQPNPLDFGYSTNDIRLQTRPTGPGQLLTAPVITLFETAGGGSSWASSTANIESAYFAAQAMVPAVASQPYIAPSSTGGPYTGGSTTATLNGVTKTWVGGYYVTAPVSATYALTSTGAGQNLTYVVPAGGQLSYTYQF